MLVPPLLFSSLLLFSCVQTLLLSLFYSITFNKQINKETKSKQTQKHTHTGKQTQQKTYKECKQTNKQINKTNEPKTILKNHIYISYSMTWVPQSKLAFGNHRRVSWPQAFGSLPTPFLSHHSFVCRWRLQLPVAIKSLFRLKITHYA